MIFAILVPNTLLILVPSTLLTIHFM
jgi:hypothetical protein